MRSKQFKQNPNPFFHVSAISTNAERRCECRTYPWSDDWKLEAIHTLIQTISLARFNSWLCELRTPECDHQFPDCCRNNSRHRYTFHPAKPSTPKISAKLPLPLCRLNTLQQKKAAIYRVCVLPWNLPSIRSQQRSIFSSPSVKRSQRKRKSAIKKPKEEIEEKNRIYKKKRKGMFAQTYMQSGKEENEK